MKKGLFFPGTSGIVLPFRNQLHYPEAYQGMSRLQVYGHLFRSLEVNAVFYKLPRAATLASWAASVPEGFRFTCKLWQEVSHAPELQFRETDICRYMELIDALGDKKGSLLVQFPASVQATRLNAVNRLLEQLQLYNNGWDIAVEFRHNSWYNDKVYAMLDKRGAALVYHDKKGSQSPHEPLSAPFVYLRFHGPDGDYRGSYDEAFLQEYAGYINDWLLEGKTVYAYFNNTMGDALRNLKMLDNLLPA